jgi:hypothetical protein
LGIVIACRRRVQPSKAPGSADLVARCDLRASRTLVRRDIGPNRPFASIPDVIGFGSVTAIPPLWHWLLLSPIIAAAAMALAYTVYSEWLNVHVRRSWAYSELMPTVPIIGIGVGSLLQWIALPTLVQWFAIARAPWIDVEQGDCPPPLDTG